MRSEVNPYTGAFPQTPTNNPPWSGTIDRRIQVLTSEVDPALNVGAVYFGEGQYIAADDAAADNAANNASYRRMQFEFNGMLGIMQASMVASTQRLQPVIHAWKAFEPEVVESEIHVPNEGLFLLAAKATDTGTGVWHYEYALQNFNSDRAGGSFSVPLPDRASITNAGFHSVAYHSGEPFDASPWTITMGPNTITWSTVDFGINPNANALRWGTLYNFYFDANVDPGANSITVGLFKPGVPVSVSTTSIGPDMAIIDCNNNGIADHLDINNGTSVDCEPNQVPDECEPDCNENGVADPCDISGGTSDDCNENIAPDECEPDCDGDGVEDCADQCPFTSPPGACLCPPLGLCCFGSGFCIEDFPRDFCLELGGVPECLEAPCHDGCLIGDIDVDGDLDLFDYHSLQSCFSGGIGLPGYVPPSAECLFNFDYDGDPDTDLYDYFTFQRMFAGP
jgi:hypothetical protein